MAAPDASRDGEVTRLLAAWQQGDKAAADRLFSLLYGELRQLAHQALADQPREATLQTTALVHELYLRLMGSFRPADKDRRHFFGLAAKVMRRILIDRARERLAEKRGNGERPATMDESRHAVETDAVELLAVEEALQALERQDPRLAQIVELRFFAGLSVAETAHLLCLSERSVKRDWQKARALLVDWMSEASGALGTG